jgi:hypothetical protein
MWLNRRSPWLDVWSWLPHQGKLVVHNKGMKQIANRKPAWARTSEIQFRLDGSPVMPAWIGDRALFTSLRGSEELTLETPLKTDKATYSLVTLNNPAHTIGAYECEFRGHTAVRVVKVGGTDPVGDQNWYRLFRRDAMLAPTAPEKPIPAYVHPEKLVRWLSL